MRPFLTYDQSHDVVYTPEELQSERWMPVCGFETYYEVSDLGRIRSLDRHVRSVSKLGLEHHRLVKGKMVHAHLDEFGYLYTSLSRGGLNYFKFVHRLVLQAFSPIVDSQSYQVNHKNYNRRDNRLVNLEWCTSEENNLHSHLNCFGNDSSNIPVTDLTTGELYPSLSSAAKDLGCKHYDSLRLCIENRKMFKGHVFVCASDLDHLDLDTYIQQVVENSRIASEGSRRPVLDLTTGQRFPTTCSAWESVGGTGAGLLVAISKQMPYKHHVFVYEDQVDSDFDVDSYVKKAFDGYVPQPMPVAIKDLSSGELYDSISAAARKLNIESEKIRLSIRDNNMCGKHLFVKLEDLESIGDEAEYYQKIRNVKCRGRSIPILDLTTGVTYSSINRVYLHLKISLVRSDIENHVAKKGHRFAYDK